MSILNGGKCSVESLSISEQKEYYEKLRNQCLALRDRQFNFGQSMISGAYPFIRNYGIELEGEENVPIGTNVLFVANHSNSHDIFTAYEMFSMLQRMGSVMVATDCLNPFTTEIFNISNATLFDRNNKSERGNSVLSLSSKIINGNDGLIFGEGTWNLHPTLPMHNIKNGSSKISLISQVPIVPVIFEYIESPSIVTTEKNLIDKCVIRFGAPIVIDYGKDLSSQSNNIKKCMADMRKAIWSDYGITRHSIDDVDPLMYVNHTYMKKFKALGFKYNSKLEQEHLLFLNNEPRENEYTINEQGDFVPGITEKGFELKKLFK